MEIAPHVKITFRVMFSDGWKQAKYVHIMRYGQTIHKPNLNTGCLRSYYVCKLSADEGL
jgi:hypothetical protein